jgi:hypothetical protein
MPPLLERTPSQQSKNFSLAPATFASPDHFHAQRVGALAIYCSDGRFGESFDQFCHHALHIPRYDRFAVPGGPAWINQIDTDLPDLYSAAKGQLDYLVRAHDLNRIILITHFACGFYKDRLKRDPMDCLSLQAADVKKAAQTLLGWFEGIAIEGYVAMRNDDLVTFHALDVGVHF